MTAHLKIPTRIYKTMLADLARPHPYAYERIGFCRVRLGNRRGETKLLLVTDYWAVDDRDYIPDENSGARINNVAIRNALQTSLDTGEGVFHVHLHDFAGVPKFSQMDNQEIPRIVESLAATNPEIAHGMLVLSPESATANTILPDQNLEKIDRISIVGQPTFILNGLPIIDEDGRFSRQSFLGALSRERIKSVRVGIIGLSGGGSHVIQQLAHIGFRDFALFDAQEIDLSNLNRLVGGTEDDVAKKRLKVEIADRVVHNLSGDAATKPIAARWQEDLETLLSCDIVFGCLDGFDERRQLEAACRRYLIPLIDVGMDVVEMPPRPPRMAGQVILSLPEHPCLQCIGFLNEKTLAAEAQKYGDAGLNPQVVWPNGALASTAVGIAVDLVTGWKQTGPGLIYKSYDGNTDNLTDHSRLEFVRDLECEHYKLSQTGEPY